MKFYSRQVLVGTRPFGRDEVLYRPNVNLTAGLDEAGDGLTLWQDALDYVLHVYRGSNLMEARLEVIIGHVLEAIANINVDFGRVLAHDGDKSIGLGTEAVLYLETARVILEEESDHAKVGVRPSTAVLARGELLSGYRGVIVHAELVDDGGGTAAVQKFTLAETKALLQELQHLATYEMALLQQAFHVFAVAGDA